MNAYEEDLRRDQGTLITLSSLVQLVDNIGANSVMKILFLRFKG